MYTNDLLAAVRGFGSMALLNYKTHLKNVRTPPRDNEMTSGGGLQQMYVDHDPANESGVQFHDDADEVVVAPDVLDAKGILKGETLHLTCAVMLDLEILAERLFKALTFIFYVVIKVALLRLGALNAHKPKYILSV